MISKQELNLAIGARISISAGKCPILGAPNAQSAGRLRPGVDSVGWESVLTAVNSLEKAGFACVGGKSGFMNLRLLWSIGTYSYANSLFGSRQIAEWARTDSFPMGLLRGECLVAEDIRCFRRNNRKLLALSLESIFRERNLIPIGALFSIDSSAYDIAEWCILEAIRWDVGDFDE